MPESPIVSVVLPTRNRAPLLERAVATVLDQTLTDIELLIIDDGSTDETPTLLANLAEREPRLRVVRRGEGTTLGAARARNEGIAAARGRFVAFLDDDTEWSADKLERQVTELDRLGAEFGVAYTPMELRHPDGRTVRIASADAHARQPLDVLLRRNFIGTPAVLVRTALLRQTGGFDPALPALQDWDLWLRLAQHTRFAYVPDALTVSRVVPGITTDAKAQVVAAELFATKLERQGVLTRHQYADVLAAIGNALMAGGLAGPARGYFVHAVRLAPDSVRLRVLLTLAQLGGRTYRGVLSLRERFAGVPMLDRAVSRFWSLR